MFIIKKTIIATLLIILSLPVAADYKIVFGLSSLDLPEPSTDEQSEVESVLSFDGPDEVTIPHSTAFNITNVITFEAWVKQKALRGLFY